MSVVDLDHSLAHWGNQSPSMSSSLSHVHISDAVVLSADDGATLDLSKLNLTDVGEPGAEELATIGRENVEDESSVLRITLGNNRLATLPMAFALLSRLRYLNLKGNSFTVFPAVLTEMPSLDTLDISHNKLKRLPSQPGSLVNLRVFCFSRNKISRIPSYFTKFQNLDILKADRNPIDWPPKSVMEFSESPGNVQAMRNWIRTMQNWMEDHTPNVELTPKASDESILNGQHELDNIIQDSYNSWSRFPVHDNEFDAGITPHARSFSIDSNFSISSIPESLQELSDDPTPPTPPDQYFPLRMGMLSSHSAPSSPPRSPERFPPSPAESPSPEKGNSATAVEGNFQQLQQQQQSHARNASFAVGSRIKKRSDLPGKKSMPDLRTAKMNFTSRPPDLPSRLSSNSQSTLTNGTGLPSPSPLFAKNYTPGSPSSPRPPRSIKPPVDSPTGPVPPMDVERNSYFRRLSTLPKSTISSAVPQSMLSAIDSARSILFAVCQVYQTLQHYTVYAIDDRLSSVLRKVLDPASSDMMQLINSLDRFDAMSRKTLPSPSVCRAVFESCKDTVAVFSKAVGVLALQLKVLATSDDVRYLRQMLLILYGATAEISYAWQAMAPQLNAVKPLLRERIIPTTKPYPSLSPTELPPLGLANGEQNPSTSGLTPPSNENDVRLQPTPRSQIGTTSNGVARVRTARRHAGSFSYKDVEIGKKLPSFEEVPHSPSISNRTSTMRATKRQVAPLSAASLFSSTSAYTSHQQAQFTSASSSTSARPVQTIMHSRQGSVSSNNTSSAASSPSLPSKSSSSSLLELPSTSRSLVDKEALDAMTVAVEAAPAVWEIMDEIFNDDSEINMDIRDSLSAAKIVTRRLARNMQAVQHGDPTADRKTLRDDAHVFVKTVVQLSNIIKTHTITHAASSALRSNMVKLTNSTEEFVILLHVSSYSPSSTPRPYSPAVNGVSAQNGSLGPPSDDGKLIAGLSRSRSAQPASSLKLIVPSTRDGPRSALPNQSFQIPAIQRVRRVEVSDGPG